MLASITALVIGCSSDLGGTPGGAQDDALANEKVAQGYVPNPEDVTVEGVLAAHDFPLDGGPCDKPLCISSAYAIAPTMDSERSAVFVQIGFDSGIDATTFRRAPLNLSVVVDRSGSMGGEKIRAVRSALSRLIDQLDAADRLSIVLFDDRVDTLLASTPVSDRESIRALLPRIVERGSTNMAAGLRAGYAQVTPFSGVAGVSDRVMVFTDALVNTGDTDEQSFVSLASANAEKDIGLTVFGVGIDLNQSLVLPISKLRGGNYLFLSDAARISSVFDYDFDYLVTPLAYDLNFTLVPTREFRVSQVYGYKSASSSLDSLSFNVPTVFLSRGHGAIVARLEPRTSWPSGNPPIASLRLEYQPANSPEIAAEDGSATYDGTEALSDSTVYYSQRRVRRTAAFVNAALGEKQACSLYHSYDTSSAVRTLERTIAFVDAEATELDDLDLTDQASLLSQLRGNMQNRKTDSHDVSREHVNETPLACAIGRLGQQSPRIPLAFGLLFCLGILRSRARNRSLVS